MTKIQLNNENKTEFTFEYDNGLPYKERIRPKYEFGKLKTNNNLAGINIYFDKNLYQDIFEYTKVGYTLLNIDINKIKSKMGIGLYEELRRITPLKQIRKKTSDNYSVSNKFKQIHSYTLEELNNICGTKYKYLSKIIEGLEVQYKKLIKKNLID